MENNFVKFPVKYLFIEPIVQIAIYMPYMATCIVAKFGIVDEIAKLADFRKRSGINLFQQEKQTAGDSTGMNLPL